MNKYSFEVSIEAQTQGEAEVKLLAASTLMQKLKAREIAKLADVVDQIRARRAFGVQPRELVADRVDTQIVGSAATVAVKSAK